MEIMSSVSNNLNIGKNAVAVNTAKYSVIKESDNNDKKYDNVLDDIFKNVAIFKAQLDSGKKVDMPGIDRFWRMNQGNTYLVRDALFMINAGLDKNANKEVDRVVTINGKKSKVSFSEATFAKFLQFILLEGVVAYEKVDNFKLDDVMQKMEINALYEEFCSIYSFPSIKTEFNESMVNSIALELVNLLINNPNQRFNSPHDPTSEDFDSFKVNLDKKEQYVKAIQKGIMDYLVSEGVLEKTGDVYSVRKDKIGYVLSEGFSINFNKVKIQYNGSDYVLSLANTELIGRNRILEKLPSVIHDKLIDMASSSPELVISFFANEKNIGSNKELEVLRRRLIPVLLNFSLIKTANLKKELNLAKRAGNNDLAASLMSKLKEVYKESYKILKDTVNSDSVFYGWVNQGEYGYLDKNRLELTTRFVSDYLGFAIDNKKETFQDYKSLKSQIEWLHENTTSQRLVTNVEDFTKDVKYLPGESITKKASIRVLKDMYSRRLDVRAGINQIYYKLKVSDGSVNVGALIGGLEGSDGNGDIIGVSDTVSPHMIWISTKDLGNIRDNPATNSDTKSLFASFVDSTLDEFVTGYNSSIRDLEYSAAIKERNYYLAKELIIKKFGAIIGGTYSTASDKSENIALSTIQLASLLVELNRNDDAIKLLDGVFSATGNLSFIKDTFGIELKGEDLALLRKDASFQVEKGLVEAKALFALEKFIEVEKIINGLLGKPLNKHKKSLLLLMKWNILFKQGKTAEASKVIADVKQTLNDKSLSPDDKMSLSLMLAQVLLKSKEVEEASKLFSSIIETKNVGLALSAYDGLFAINRNDKEKLNEYKEKISKLIVEPSQEFDKKFLLLRIKAALGEEIKTDISTIEALPSLEVEQEVSIDMFIINSKLTEYRETKKSELLTEIKGYFDNLEKLLPKDFKSSADFCLAKANFFLLVKDSKSLVDNIKAGVANITADTSSDVKFYLRLLDLTEVNKKYDVDTLKDLIDLSKFSEKSNELLGDLFHAYLLNSLFKTQNAEETQKYLSEYQKYSSKNLSYYQAELDFLNKKYETALEGFGGLFDDNNKADEARIGYVNTAFKPGVKSDKTLENLKDILSEVSDKTTPTYKLAEVGILFKEIEELKSNLEDISKQTGMIEDLLKIDIHTVEDSKVLFWIRFAQLKLSYLKGSLTSEVVDGIEGKEGEYKMLSDLAYDDEAKYNLNLFFANYYSEQVIDEKDDNNLNATTKYLSALPKPYQQKADYKLANIRLTLKAKNAVLAEQSIKGMRSEYETLTDQQKISYNFAILELFNLAEKPFSDKDLLKKLDLPENTDLIATLTSMVKTTKDKLTLRVLQAVNILNRQATKEADEYAKFNTFLKEAETLVSGVSDTKAKTKEQNNIDLLRGLGHFQRREYGHASEKFMQVINFYFEDNDKNKPIKQMNDKERNEYLRTLGVYIATYLKANKAPGSSLKLADIKLDTLLPSTFIGRDTDLNDIKRSYALDLMFAKKEYKELIDKSFEGQVPPAGDVVNQKLELLQGFAHLYVNNDQERTKLAKGISDKVAGDSVIVDVDNKILLLSLEQEITYADKSALKSDNLSKRIEDNFNISELQLHQKTQLVDIYRKYLQRTGQDTKTFDALIGSGKKLAEDAPFINKLAVEADKYDIEIKNNLVEMEDFIKNFPTQFKERLVEVDKMPLSIYADTNASSVLETISALRQVQRFDIALKLTEVALDEFKKPNEQKELLKLQVEIKLELMQLKKPAEREADAKEINILINTYGTSSNDAEVQAEVVLQRIALDTAQGETTKHSLDASKLPANFDFLYQMMLAYNKMSQEGFSDYAGVRKDVDEAFGKMPLVDQVDYKEALMGIYIRMVDSAKGDYKIATLVDENGKPLVLVPMSWDQAATLLSAIDKNAALTLLGRLANTPEDSLLRIKSTLAGYDSFSYVEGNETYPQYFESLGATPADKSKSTYGFLQTPYGLRWIDSRKSSVADSSSTVPVDVVVDRIGNSSRTLGPLKIETSSNTQLQDFTTASQSMSLNNTNVQLIKGVNAIEETVIKHGEAWIKVPRPPVEGEYPDQQYFDDVKIPISWPEQVLVPHDFGNKKLDPNYKYLLDTQEVKATLPLTKDMSLFGAYSEQKDISANNSVLGPTSFKKEDSGNLFDVRKVEAGVSLRGSGTDEISFSGTHYFSDQQVGSVVADGAIVNKPPVENEFKANFSKQLPGNFTFMGYYQMDNRGQTHGELGLQYQDKTTGKIYIYFTQGKYDYLTSDGYGNVEAKTFGARWEKTYQAATGELTLFLETQLRSDNNAKKINDGPLVRLGVENTNNLGDGGSFRQEVAATIQNPGEGPLSSVGAAMIYRNNLKGFLSSSLLGKEVRVDLLAEDNKKLEDLLGLGGKRAKIDSFNASKYKGAFQIENGSLICKDRKSFDELIDELGKMREYQLASVLLETKLRSNIDTLISKNSSFDGVSNNELLEYKKLLDSFENKSNIFVKRDKEELKLGFLRSIDPLANTLLAKISYQVSVQYILAEIFVRDHGGTADKIDFKPEQIQQLMANVKIAVDDLNILGFETRIKIGSSLVNILSHPEALLNIGVECIKDFRVNEDTKFRLGGELSTFDPHLHAEFLMEFNNKYTVSLGNQMGVEVIDDTGAKVQAGVKIDLLGLFGYGRSVIAITFNNKKASNLHGGVVDYFSFGRTGFFIRQEKNPGQQFEFASGEVLSAYQYFGKTNYKILVASVGSEHFKYLEAWVKDVCSIKGTGDKQIKIMYDEEDAIKLYHIERFQELELFKTLVTELYKRKDKGIEGFKILNAVFLNRNENKFDGDTLSVDMDTLKSMVREINKNSSGRTAEVIINEYLNKFLGNNHTQRVSVHNQLIQDVVGEGLFVSGLSMSKLEKSPNYKYSKGKLSITGALTKHEFDMLKNIGCSVDDRKQIDKLLLKYEVKENITYLADKGLEFKFSDNKLISRIANDDLALLGLNKTLSVLRNELDANIQEMVFNIDDSGVCGFFRSKELKRYTLNIALENLKSIGKDKADISENDIINTIRGEVSRINYVDKNLSSLMAMLNKERIDVDFYHNIQRSKDTGNAVFSIKMRGASKYNKQTWDYEVIKNNSGEIALFEIKDGERKQIQIDSQSNVFHRALFLMFKGGGKVPSAYVQIFNNAKLNASENAKEQALLGSTPVVDQVALKEATEVLQFKQIVLEAKRKDLKTANSNIQNLSERLATAESNLVKLRAEVARLEQEIADLNVELGPKKEEASSKQKALDLLKAEVIVLEAAVKALPEIVQNATKALEAERQNESALKSKIDENEKKLAELNKQSEGLDRFTQGKSKYEAELVSTKKQLAEEEGKWFFKSKGLIESLKNAKQVQENVIKAYTNKIAEATKAKADSLPIAQEQSKLVAQHKLSGESITVLAAEEQRVILELETKNRDLVAKNGIVSALTAEIAALNLQVADLGKQIEAKQALATSAQNSVEDNEAIKVSVEPELAQVKADLPVRQAAVAKAEQAVARAKQAVNSAGQPTQNTQQFSNTPALPSHAVERPLVKSVPSTVVASKISNVAAKSAVTSIRTQLGGISTPSFFTKLMDFASPKPWTDLHKLEDITDVEFIQAVVYLTRNNTNQPEANIANAEAIKRETLNWNVNFDKLMKHYKITNKRELVYVAVAKKMKDEKVTEKKEDLLKELAKIKDSEVRNKLVEILIKAKIPVDYKELEVVVLKANRRSSSPGFRK